MKAPARWLEEPEALPEELVASMQAYRELGPSPRELARIRAGLRWKAAPLLKVAALVGTVGGLTAWLAWPAAQPAASVAGPAIQAAIQAAPAIQAAIPEAAPEIAAPAALERAPTQKPRAKVARNAVPPLVEDPTAELALLQRARRAVVITPSVALALTEEHARSYPRGAFVQERELIAIEALSHTDRAAAAERARRFVQRYPQSAHRTRIEVLLGAH